MQTKCEIILLSYESPDLLKKCVSSVLENTRVQSTLIIVDNGSKDPRVGQYLRNVNGNETVRVEKVFCEENAGFSRGINKGLRLSEAPFVCILNNDCVVGERWLTEMIAISQKEENIGLINPMSNTFGSKPDNNVTVNDHSRLLSYQRGKYTEMGNAIGFACLIKRAVIEKIGFLDEIYEGVCYEDTDYSVRAMRVGYISVIAEGAYVYHQEQASRAVLPGKEKIYARNKEIFEDKWGKTLRVFFMDNEKSKDALGKARSEYETLKKLARQRVYVEMWVTGGKEGKNLKTSAVTQRTIRHADIKVRCLRSRVLWLRVLWKILTKKKKYDAIVIRKGLISGILKVMAFFRGTTVYNFMANDIIRKGTERPYDLNSPADFTIHLRGN